MFNSKKLLSAVAVAAILSATSLAGAQAAQSTGSQGPIYVPPVIDEAETYDKYDISNYEQSRDGIYAHQLEDGTYDIYDPTRGIMDNMSYSEIMSNYSSNASVPSQAELLAQYSNSVGAIGISSIQATQAAQAAAASSYNEVHQDIASSYNQGHWDAASSYNEVHQDLASSYNEVHQDLASSYNEVHQDVASYLWDSAKDSVSQNTDYFQALAGVGLSSANSGGSFLSDAASSLWGSYDSSGQSALTSQANNALSSYLGSNSALGNALGSVTESNLSFGVAVNNVVTDGALGMFPSENFVGSVSAMNSLGGLQNLGSFYEGFANTSFANALGISSALNDGASKLNAAASDGMNDLMGSLSDSFGDFSLSDFSMGDFSMGGFDIGSFDLGSLDFASFDMASITGGFGDVLGGFDVGGFDLGSFDMSSITDSITGALSDSISGMLGDVLGGFDMGSIVSGIGSFFG